MRWTGNGIVDKKECVVLYSCVIQRKINLFKCTLYKTLIKPVLTYASETWPLGKKDKLRLAVFEMKILRRIYGPVKDDNVWRIRYSQELYQIHNAPNIIQTIKIARLRWVGHVKRMNECEMPRRIMEYGISG